MDNSPLKGDPEPFPEVMHILIHKLSTILLTSSGPGPRIRGRTSELQKGGAISTKTKDEFEGFKIVKPDLLYWAPKVAGDILSGVYSGSFQGTKHTRHTLRGEEGQGWIIPNTLYIRELFKDKVPVGSIVRIRYEGFRLTRRGTPIYDYTIGVKVCKEPKSPAGKEDPI